MAQNFCVVRYAKIVSVGRVPNDSVQAQATDPEDTVYILKKRYYSPNDLYVDDDDNVRDSEDNTLATVE